MKQVLFVQGGGPEVHDDWDAKLVASLTRELGSEYDIRYPRMPDESAPSYTTWSAALQRELANLDDGAIAVGHSIGGTILIHTLAEHPHPVGAIVLIAAPFVGDGGWPADDWQPQDNLGRKLAAPVYLFHGLADATAPPAHAELYARAIPQAQLCRLPGRDHQLDNDLHEIADQIRQISPMVVTAR